MANSWPDFEAVIILDADGNQVTSFGASGGTSATDDAAFTAGSGTGTPAMGFFSADVVDAGDVGVLAMDASRRLLVSLEVDNAGIGGGTQYTENATDASITGTVAMMEVAADAIEPVQGTVADGLLVNLGANNDVTIASVTPDLMLGSDFSAVWGTASQTYDYDTDAGTDTTVAVGIVVPSTTGAVEVTGDAANGLDVDVTRVGGTVTIQEAAAMDVSAAVVTVDLAGNNDVTIDGSSIVHLEDVPHVTADAGVMMMAVRNDGLGATFTDTTGDYSPIAVGPTGYLFTQVEGKATHDQPVTNANSMVPSTGESANFDGAALPNAVGAEADIVRFKASLEGVQYVMAVSEDGSTIGQVSGDLTQNNAAPAATNLGVLPAIANAAAPTYTEGNQVLLSTDTAGALRVTGGGGGTEYVEDAIAAANPTGTALILVADSTPALEVAEGDNVAMRGTRYGAAYTQIVDSSGSFVDTFGGGTQHAEDDAHTTADVGNFMLGVRNDSGATVFSDTDGDYTPIAVNARGAVRLEAQKAEDEGSVGGGSGFPVLAIRDDALVADAEVNADGDHTWLRVNNDGALWNSPAPLTATGTLTAVDQSVELDLQGYGAAAINLSGTWVGTVGFDATIDGSTWINIVMLNAGETLSATQSGNSQNTANVGGYKSVRAYMDAYTSGTVQVDIKASLGSAIREGIFSEDTAHSSGHAGQFILGVRNDALGTTFSGTDGDYSPIAVTSTGAVHVNPIPAQTGIAGGSGTVGANTTRVTLATDVALPAGDNNIGNVDIVSGTVDTVTTVTTVTALTDITGGVVPGVGATDLGKQEDEPHTTGDTGVMMLGVRNDSGTALSGLNGDYTPLGLTDSGQVRALTASEISGHDTPVGNVRPSMLGLEAATFDGAALPNNVNAEGDIERAKGSLSGVQYIMPVSQDGSATAIHIEDEAHAAADGGFAIFGVANDVDDTAPLTRITTEGDYAFPAMDFDGAQFVRNGTPQQWDYHLNTSTAQTDASVHASPGAGLSLYVTDIVFSHDGTAAINMFLEEGASTVAGPFYLQALAGGMALHFEVPKKVTAATALTITTSASHAHSAEIIGFVGQG